MFNLMVGMVCDRDVDIEVGGLNISSSLEVLVSLVDISASLSTQPEKLGYEGSSRRSPRNTRVGLHG